MHETKITFHLPSEKKLCGYCGFSSWYWLDSKVRRNTEEFQWASLANDAWCCDQERWQNLNFPKQVWNLWQTRRQIIAAILGAEESDFIIGLSLKIPLPVTARWVAHVLSFQPLSHLYARCGMALRAPWSVNALLERLPVCFQTSVFLLPPTGSGLKCLRLFNRNRELLNLRLLSFLQGQQCCLVSLQDKQCILLSEYFASSFWWFFLVCSHPVPNTTVFKPKLGN